MGSAIDQQRAALASIIKARTGLTAARRRPSLLLAGDALAQARGCFATKDFQDVEAFKRDEADCRQRLEESSLN